jgi:hypothetical protein
MLVGAWLIATLVATLVAWAAVRQVTDQVSPPGAFPLPTAVALGDPSPTPTAAEQQRPPRTRQRRSNRPTRPADQQPPAATDPPPAAVDSPAPAQADPAPTAKAEPEPEPEPASRTEGYQMTGGFVTVRYSGADTQLVQATPNSGFVVEIKDRGPDKVEVRFRSDSHESRLVTQIRDGQPDPEVDEQQR